MFTIVENILAESGVIFAKNNCGTGYATEGEVVWELEIVYTDCHDGDTECHYQKIFYLFKHLLFSLLSFVLLIVQI